MAKRAALHHIVGNDAEKAAFGPAQAAWLVEQGHAHLVKVTETSEATEVRLYASVSNSARELDDLVRAQPHLRECDFCRRTDAPWNINHRPFPITFPGASAPTTLDRPMAACDGCVRFIRDNDKRGLVEHAVRRAWEDSGVKVSLDRAREQLTPFIREVVYGTFANRQGYPERA